MSRTYPKFISNKPRGEDSFSGGSHQKIAEKVSKIIKNDLLETKIIGLEGNWGSGKSNVVKIIQENLSKDGYYTFIFDAWGNQEDLTRKSFLEQIINELFEANLISDVDNWKKLEAQLLAKFSKSFKQKFPKIKNHWFFVVFSFVILGVLTGFYEHVLLRKDFFETIYFGFWKPVISIYLFPLILFLIGCILIIKEYLSTRKSNKLKKRKDQETKWDTLGKILYWFKGQDIETEETETILEDEPSVQMFREYFTKIEQDVAKKGKIIIVFDNIDRLEAIKVKSLWSSIHTFFAESRNGFQSYVIIPYNKKELLSHYSNQKSGLEFIEKSIPISFRITPPIVTDWESFLSAKIDDAFGIKIIETTEKAEMISLFNSFFNEAIITPRKIINYVNNLVGLYLQWENEINKGKIKIKYLVLYNFAKDQIIEDPYSSILSRDYMPSVDEIFDDKEELDETLAALTFGVDRSIANEVLLLREFQNNLRNGKSHKLITASEHSAFKHYFNRAYQTTNMASKINHITSILNSLSDKLSPQMLKYYWNDLAVWIPSFSSEMESFNENHKQILLNAERNKSITVVKNLIESLKRKLSDKSEADQNTYYQEILSIENFINQQDSFSLDVKKLLQPVEFTVLPYLEFIRMCPDTFNDYNINCTEAIIEEHVFDTGGTLKVKTLADNISEYVILMDKKQYKFEKIKIKIKEQFKSVQIDKIKSIQELIEISNVFFEKPILLRLSTQFYPQFTVEKLDIHDAYIDCLCISIGDLDNAIKHPNFQHTLNSLTQIHVDKISKKIELYLNYGDILKLITENLNWRKYGKLKSIAHVVTEDEKKVSSQSISVDWVVKSYSRIIQRVFDSNELKEGKFLEKLEGLESDFNTSIGDLDQRIFKHFNKKDNPFIQKIIKESIEYINHLSKDEFLISFSDKNKNFKILESLVLNGLIDGFTPQFYSAFDDYFKSLIKQGRSDSELDFWNTLIDLMDARKLKSTYTSIRDILIVERGDINEDEILFLGKGLIAHGNLDKSADGSTLKFIIPMIKFNRSFPHFLSKKDKLMNIIENSNEHSETAISELETRFKSEKFKENTVLIEIAEKYGWTTSDDEDN